MSGLTNYQFLLSVALVVALVLIARDGIRSVIGLRAERDALRNENRELKAKVSELSKSREEITEHAYETFSRRLENRAHLERLALRDLVDLVWQCNPKAVKEVFQDFVKERRTN